MPETIETLDDLADLPLAANEEIPPDELIPTEPPEDLRSLRSLAVELQDTALALKSALELLQHRCSEFQIRADRLLSR